MISHDNAIVELVAKGYSTKQIADKLCMGKTTVDTYRYRMLKKYGVNNSSQLVAHFYETGKFKTHVQEIGK